MTRHRLGQVFHNIILNAIQAMPDGGTLCITISGREICFAMRRSNPLC
jgi:signal transduction histidine kinase